MEWQPFETAPKDGTDILISQYGIFEVIYWDGIEWCCAGLPNYLSGLPSHWMPIPEPPECGEAVKP